MAIKGLSIPVVGKYSCTEKKVSYSDGVIAGSAVEYSVSWTTSESNNLYADNNVEETDAGTFQNGELTLGTSDLTQEVSKLILGLKTASFSYGEDKTAEENVYDDDAAAPDLGYGIIEMHQINNVTKFRAVVLPRIRFNLPELSATTKGESIEWQTPSITATIMRSEQVDSNYKKPWMMDAWFETESDAIEYLKAKLGVTEPSSASITEDEEIA